MSWLQKNIINQRLIIKIQQKILCVSSQTINAFSELLRKSLMSINGAITSYSQQLRKLKMIWRYIHKYTSIQSIYENGIGVKVVNVSK